MQRIAAHRFPSGAEIILMHNGFLVLAGDNVVAPYLSGAY